MEILLALVSLVALASFGLSVVLVRKVALLESRIGATRSLPPTPAMELPERPIQGLTVGLRITQDHERPLFAELLKEQLLAEDVADVRELRGDEDIRIEGELVCNGYAEIYYTAEFACSTRSGPVCILIEKPPHGDRPTNLALELVAKLKRELAKQGSRDARRSAIRELSS